MQNDSHVKMRVLWGSQVAIPLGAERAFTGRRASGDFVALLSVINLEFMPEMKLTGRRCTKAQNHPLMNFGSFNISRLMKNSSGQRSPPQATAYAPRKALELIEGQLERPLRQSTELWRAHRVGCGTASATKWNGSVGHGASDGGVHDYWASFGYMCGDIQCRGWAKQGVGGGEVLARCWPWSTHPAVG